MPSHLSGSDGADCTAPSTASVLSRSGDTARDTSSGHVSNGRGPALSVLGRKSLETGSDSGQCGPLGLEGQKVPSQGGRPRQGAEGGEGSESEDGHTQLGPAVRVTAGRSEDRSH